MPDRALKLTLLHGSPLARTKDNLRLEGAIMYEINRLLMAIISKSDTARPFFEFIASTENLSYEDAKNKTIEEVINFIKRDYEIEKRFNDNDEHSSSFTMEKYLKEPEVMLRTVNFLINRFTKNIDHIHELIKVIHTI